MIKLFLLKQKVKELVEGITNLKAFSDVVPTNIKTGALIIKSSTEFTGRTIDGEAHIAQHTFEVVIFSFENAEICDELTCLLVDETDGKYSQDFRLIEVSSITPTQYEPDTGFWANAINMEFIER